MIKKEGRDVLVGDRVEVDSLDETNATGRVVQVLERQNQLSRPKIANITLAVVVASIDSPPLDLQQLDRYVTHVHAAGVRPVICISKLDLLTDADKLKTVREIYEPLDIPVYFTSIKDDTSVRHLFRAIHGETVVLAGQSGVGKSSLLNALLPELDLAVGEVSDKLQRGTHTTRHVSLIAFEGHTYIADTPGFSYLKFDTIDPHDLEAIFQDFAPYRDQCRFPDCLHLDEVDCAVQANLRYISPSRYESYRVFQEEARAYVDMVQTTSQKEEYGYKTLKKGKKQDLQILKLPEKQRATSRRTQRQQILDWSSEEDDTLEE